MATLSDIADLDSGIVSSEATPESHTSPTSVDDKVISDKKEATSGEAIEELVSSAVEAATQEIQQQPKQNSDVSSTVVNDDDDVDDENFEIIQEPESDMSIITTSEENTPTRDVKEGIEEIKGKVGNILEEIPAPSKVLSSHETVEDVLSNKLSNDQDVVEEDDELIGEAVTSESVTTVNASPDEDKDLDNLKESEPQSFESFAIINDSSLESSNFTGNKNIKSNKEPALVAETVNEPSQKALITNETTKKADHDSVSDTEIKDDAIVSDTARDSGTVEPDSSIESELVKGSSQPIESISELNEESEILSKVAQDNQNDSEPAQVSTSSLSTTLTKVEQDKEGKCYEMISDPDSGVATPESSVLTPTSEEIVAPPPPAPVEEAEEVKEEAKEEVVEQIITSGVAAAVEAAAASEPQPTPAAKENSTEATTSTTETPAPPAAAAATTAAAAASTSSDSSSKTSAAAPKPETKVPEPSKPSSSSSAKSSTSATTTIAKVGAANELDDDDDDDEDLDESLAERIWGLTEMFPDSLRTTSVNTVNSTLSFIKGSYEMSRSVVWVVVSSSLLLFAPVMFELERINVEEMMKQDRNRLVLGPGSAMSGSPAPGMMPGPAR